VRLHWTDEAYDWHVNDGAEAFVVLDGLVHMHYREDGLEKVVELGPGSIFVVEEGDEHAARPKGEARVLVIERKGSV
jgi:mannose-6-phosphate isomerase-like protein (cupin superfamily)